MIAGRTTLLSMLACAMTVVTMSMGCVSLDKPTTKIKAPMIKTPQAMAKATKNTGNALLATVKKVLPKRKPKMQIADAPIAKDDPTRLDYDPGKIGPDLYVSTAKMAEQGGRFDMALQQYNKALQADGSSRPALIGMARLQHRIGRNADAIQTYHNALNAHSGDAVIMNDLGLCYARDGQLNRAIDFLSQATQVSPDRAMYSNNLAAALVEANRTQDALTFLTKKMGPAIANFKVGYLLHDAGQTQESSHYLNEALAINPQLQQARDLLETQVPQVSSLVRE